MEVKIVEKVYKYCYYSVFLAKYEFYFRPPIRQYLKGKQHRSLYHDYRLHYAIKRNMVGDYHILNNKLDITEITGIRDSLIEIKDKDKDKIKQRKPFSPMITVDNKHYSVKWIYYPSIHKKRLYYSLNNNVNLKFLKRGEKVDTTKLKRRVWHSLFGIHIYTDMDIKNYINCIKYSLENIGYKNVQFKLVNDSNEFANEFPNTHGSTVKIISHSGSGPRIKYRYTAKKIVVNY